MTIKNLEEKVAQQINEYKESYECENVSIEEYTRNEAEEREGFFDWLFDTDEDFEKDDLTEEQESDFEEFIEALNATYEPEPNSEINNFDAKVFDAICDYINDNIHKEVTIEEFTRNDAEYSDCFFRHLFDLEEDMDYKELTEEQLSEYENFISVVVARYNEEYAEEN